MAKSHYVEDIGGNAYLIGNANGYEVIGLIVLVSKDSQPKIVILGERITDRKGRHVVVFSLKEY